jgi:hypothetical protein
MDSAVASLKKAEREAFSISLIQNSQAEKIFRKLFEWMFKFEGNEKFHVMPARSRNI